MPACAFQLLVEATRAAPALAAGVYAECHLSHPTRTDLVVRLHPVHRDRLIQASCDERLGGLMRAWQDQESPLSFVLAIDLEFDLPGRVHPWFACPLFEPEFLGGVDRILERDRARACQGLASLAEAAGPGVLRTLHGAEITPATLGQLERCRRAMPSWSAFMPGWVRPSISVDGSPVVRALVTVARHELPAYLTAIGWGGDAIELHDALGAFGGGEVKVTADLTIGPEGVRPILGLYWERFSITPRDASVARVRRGVEDLALSVDPRRWRGLLDWIDGREGGPRRSLSLKLVLVRGAPMQLKAYVPNFDAHAALAAAVAGKAA